MVEDIERRQELTAVAAGVGAGVSPATGILVAHKLYAEKDKFFGEKNVASVELIALPLAIGSAVICACAANAAHRLVFRFQQYKAARRWQKDHAEFNGS